MGARQQTTVHQRRPIVVTEPGEIGPQRARYIRGLTGKTPARLAEFLGVSPGAVRNWEIDQTPAGSMSLVLALIEEGGLARVALTSSIETWRSLLTSERISAIRSGSLLSQADFAKLLMMNRDMLGRLEQGKSRPSAGAARLLALVSSHGIDHIVLRGSV